MYYISAPGYPTQRNMCDKELDQLLSSPRLCHGALDVSRFLSPLFAETDIPYTRRINTANSCICHIGKDGGIVDRVHGFDLVRHVHSSRKDGSGSRMLVSSVTCMRVTLRANETLYEIQYSHSYNKKVASAHSALTRFLTKPSWPLSLPVVFPASFPLQ